MLNMGKDNLCLILSIQIQIKIKTPGTFEKNQKGVKKFLGCKFFFKFFFQTEFQFLELKGWWVISPSLFSIKYFFQ